jgi:hypothetical protein
MAHRKIHPSEFKLLPDLKPEPGQEIAAVTGTVGIIYGTYISGFQMRENGRKGGLYQFVKWAPLKIKK